VRRSVAILVIVLGAPMLQGALATFLPIVFRPDLALLVVFGLALGWRDTATGLVLAAVCGFVVDLLSGALLGQHALLLVLEFLAMCALSVQVSMLGVVPQVVCAAALTVVHAIGMVGLTTFFTPGADLALPRMGVVLPLVALNAILAPVVVGVVSGIVSWALGEDLGRRHLRIATRGWVP
jgi:rod shape-determining protein MreD